MDNGHICACCGAYVDKFSQYGWRVCPSCDPPKPPTDVENQELGVVLNGMGWRDD